MLNFYSGNSEVTVQVKTRNILKIHFSYPTQCLVHSRIVQERKARAGEKPEGGSATDDIPKERPWSLSPPKVQPQGNMTEPSPLYTHTHTQDPLRVSICPHRECDQNHPLYTHTHIQDSFRIMGRDGLFPERIQTSLSEKSSPQELKDKWKIEVVAWCLDMRA